MSGKSTLEFLSSLRSLGVKLSAEDGRLRYNAPSGMMTLDLLDELAARKTEILNFLREAGAASHMQAPAIVAAPRSGELPLSFAQMRLWLLDRLEPGMATYNVPADYRLKGKLDLGALEKSLRELVRRHEASCARVFRRWRGDRYRRSLRRKGCGFAVVDLQGLRRRDALEREVARLAAADAQRPFDLGQGPLLRVSLLKLGEQEHVLLLNVHHIVFDGWSWGVLALELSVLYAAYGRGEESPLGELAIQYGDFAVWQREWMQGEVLEGQLNYWKEKLGGSLPVLELPTDRVRPSVQTYRGSTISFDLSKSVTEGLQKLSREEGVTLYVTLLAAFDVLLMRYTGQEDVVVGTPIANRNRAEVEGLIGFFVNTLVMRSDLSGNPGFRQLLGRVQETALDAYAHQDLPFEKLVEELKPERNLSRSPIIQVMFSLLNAPQQPLELSGVEVRRMEVENGTSKFDLSLYAMETAEGLRCVLEYNTDLFDADRMERMAGHWEMLLEGIVAHPEQSVHELPLLTPREREQLLVEWNQTRADFPRDKCIHELVEEQVEQQANRVAVTGPTLAKKRASSVALTYTDLDRRANALAWLSPISGGGAGGLGRGMRGTYGGVGGELARCAESGWGVCSFGPSLSASTPALHSGRNSGAGGADPKGARCNSTQR